MKHQSDTLKAANLKWLVTLALLDAVVILLFLTPELLQSSFIAIPRASAAAGLPVPILLLTGLLSHNAKARLIYWRIEDPLPGCRAFTKYALADARIDMKALAKNVGALPNDPREQNAKWYKLYRPVRHEASVLYAHKLYLIYRDMATMSLLLAPLVPLALWHAEVATPIRWITGCLFVFQYLVCSICARNSGARLVCNVLAIHSTTKVKDKAQSAVAGAGHNHIR